jgi:hypothetical protein
MYLSVAFPSAAFRERSTAQPTWRYHPGDEVLGAKARCDMTRIRRSAAVVGAIALLAAAGPGAADGPFQFHSLTPCRVIDTRNSAQVQGGYGPILTSGVERMFPIQGNCGVPVGAKAATVNVTAVSPTNQGRFTLYPSGIATPQISTINFPPATNLANGAIVPLADQSLEPNDLAVMPYVVGSGQVHLVLDVTGYFE